MKRVETELTYYKRLEKIGAELAEAVLAWWDKHVRDSGQLDSLSDRMVALAREFQKAKEE
jgi:hypothetical protein